MFDDHSSAEVFDRYRRKFTNKRAEFSERELIDLTMAVVTINGYNRLNVAFRVEGGNYQPGQWDETKATSQSNQRLSVTVENG